MFVGWIMVCILGECVALSLAELASRYPTSAGPYYWAYQLASPSTRTAFSFMTGWVWLIGNWTITLSVNFGMASLIAATVALYHPEFTMSDWQLLLVFYAMCVLTFFIVAFGNKMLPMVDTICAAFTLLAIIATMIAMSAKADLGRHSPSTTLVCCRIPLGIIDDADYLRVATTTVYPDGAPFRSSLAFFPVPIRAFMLRLLRLASMLTCRSFSAIGMITSMAEECGDATVKLPRAMSLCVPVGGTAGLFFVGSPRPLPRFIDRF